MNDAKKPVSRRRIAGERPAAAPVTKPVVRKPSAKRAPAAKVTVPPAAPAQSAPKIATPPKVRTATKPAPELLVPEPSAASDSPVATASSRSRRDMAPGVLLALLAIVSMVVGTVMLVNGVKDSGGSGDDVATAQSQASAAAASAAESIFSFRYDQLDEHLTTSKALMTPAFAKDFEKIAPALTELAPQRKIVVKAMSSEAAALPCGDDCTANKAEVLVFLDQARLVGDATTPTVFANRVKVSMVRSGGTWLVSDIRAL